MLPLLSVLLFQPKYSVGGGEKKHGKKKKSEKTLVVVFSNIVANPFRGRGKKGGNFKGEEIKLIVSLCSFAQRRGGEGRENGGQKKRGRSDMFSEFRPRN